MCVQTVDVLVKWPLISLDNVFLLLLVAAVWRSLCIFHIWMALQLICFASKTLYDNAWRKATTTKTTIKTNVSADGVSEKDR